MARAPRSGSFGGEMTTRAPLFLLCLITTLLRADSPPLPKIRVASDGRTFVTESGRSFIPFGVNYYRPGTGWAPQVWKKFDAEATRLDFARMRELGVNCVRVFLAFGSFYTEPGRLNTDGFAKLDQFLSIAEASGIYVHPTGPDHWEGVPLWAQCDRKADERYLSALETFWKLFAARYRGRTVIFAYDLLNEPVVGWDTPAMRPKWTEWLHARYRTPRALTEAWGASASNVVWNAMAIPAAKFAPGSHALSDFQHFREDVADEWTRRQTVAIKSADPQALVTVGCIQHTVPALAHSLQSYAAFRPERMARRLDFLEIHFYPSGLRGQNDDAQQAALLECGVREMSRANKPVVLAEFGWHGGGVFKTRSGVERPVTEEEQARWCRRAVETTAGWVCGWLNWGFHDHPEANDLSQLSGLLTVDGRLKLWGREFQSLAACFREPANLPGIGPRPALDWDRCTVDPQAAAAFRDDYCRAFAAEQPAGGKSPTPTK